MPRVAVPSPLLHPVYLGPWITRSAEPEGNSKLRNVRSRCVSSLLPLIERGFATDKHRNHFVGLSSEEHSRYFPLRCHVTRGIRSKNTDATMIRLGIALSPFVLPSILGRLARNDGGALKIGLVIREYRKRDVEKDEPRQNRHQSKNGIMFRDLFVDCHNHLTFLWCFCGWISSSECFRLAVSRFFEEFYIIRRVELEANFSKLVQKFWSLIFV